jgi:hypothetical protein
MRRFAIILTLLALLLVAGRALAQPNADGFELSRDRADAGAGTWEDPEGEFELRGTIGQPEGGAVASGEDGYRLVGGFRPGGISDLLRQLFLPLILR